MPSLLIYSRLFFPSVGGIESFARDHAAYFAAQGWKVSIVTETLLGSASEPRAPYAVHRCPSWAARVSLFRGSDLVHIAGPAALPMLLARVLKRRTFVSHHNYQACCPAGNLWNSGSGGICTGHFMRGELQKCMKCLGGGVRSATQVVKAVIRRALMTGSLTHVANSHHTAARIQLETPVVVHLGVPWRRENPWHYSDGLGFCYVGGLDRIKGVHILLHAFAKVRRIHVGARLRIIGDGPHRPEFVELAGRLALNDAVSFRGQLHPNELEQALESTMVLPSLCEETFGLVVAEHMMRGGVVIASRIGGIPEVVGDGGVLVPPGDVNALADAMAGVAADPEMRRDLGERARERVLRDFTLAQASEAWVRVYRTLARTDSPVCRV